MLAKLNLYETSSIGDAGAQALAAALSPEKLCDFGIGVIKMGGERSHAGSFVFQLR